MSKVDQSETIKSLFKYAYEEGFNDGWAEAREDTYINIEAQRKLIIDECLQKWYNTIKKEKEDETE